MKNINKLIPLLLVLAIVLSFSARHFFEQNQSSELNTTSIYKNGTIYKRINLTAVPVTEFIITDDGGHFNIIEIKNGQVRVKESNCPNKICVNTGWLSKPGQMSVCVPNGLKVIIEGKPADIDDISY
ncbi:MAG TPA: NusG domain II-containing protein [Desulfotomaculum sp.]|nr:MAG: hypothetical protein VR67_02600 [Peptococcaceae bacterium BRH_c8a]KJS76045.1 MAG: hypothetical protein JL56_06480 [Desulfotomaculum sp. BICA1-6]HBX24598.1 NusG domain II-containing protein [Desulfotomaculum sp.]